MQNQYDIVIVGGGLIALALLIALKGAELRILVLDKKKPTLSSQSYPLSLSHISHVILKTMGVWPTLAQKACPIHAVHVSERDMFGYTQFEADEFGLAALGYVISQNDLLQTLTTAAKEIALFSELAHIDAIECGEQTTLIKFSDDQGNHEISTQLLIGADGVQSPCRNILKIKTRVLNDHEEALLATVQLQRPHQCKAYERFTHCGPLAFLPGVDRYDGQIVWSLSTSQSQKKITMTPDVLRFELQRSLGKHLGSILELKHLQQFPLHGLVAEEQIRPGFVLLGNSAHTLSPVTAQGFNLGLRDVAALAEVIHDAMEFNKSLGSIEQLNHYLKWRAADQKGVVAMTSRITEIFGLDLPGMNRARGLSLLACDIIKPLKKRLAKRMMGMAEPLPRLARGVPLYMPL